MIKVTILSEHEHLLRYVDFLRSDARVSIKTRNPSHPFLRFGKRIPIAIFDNSVRSSSERARIRKAMKKHHSPILTIINAGPPEDSVHLEWGFNDNVIPFCIKCKFAKKQQARFLAWLESWPQAPSQTIKQLHL